jgi:hypothetical protein
MAVEEKENMTCPKCGGGNLADAKVPGYMYCVDCGRGSLPKPQPLDARAHLGDGEGARKEHVNHPSHYGGKDNPYEHIKVAEGWGLSYHLGNATKYLSRAGKKGSAKEDLQKALWYIRRARSHNAPRASTGALFRLPPANVAEAWGLSPLLSKVLEESVAGSYHVAEALLSEVIDAWKDQ